MGNRVMSAELRALVAELPPCWQAWRGLSGTLFARRGHRSTPRTVVRGDTVAEVLAQIRQRELRL